MNRRLNRAFEPGEHAEDEERSFQPVGHGCEHVVPLEQAGDARTASVHNKGQPLGAALCLPRTLAPGAGYEGFLSTAISDCSICEYCSSVDS